MRSLPPAAGAALRAARVPASPRSALVRAAGCAAVLALVAACGSQGPKLDSAQEAARYAAHARNNYTPPGPPSDPWGPYIIEAAAKYDVPERWVREVMRAESGGRLYEHGQLITSAPGAMGLMQVMPGTYDELRARYGFSDDPYDPHDNILAGTAYIRELYDIYGSPGFLAAYNAGPGRFDDYLTRNRPLPAETRHYVAKIGPHIADSQPAHVSPAQQYAMNQIPVEIPAGPRYPRSGRNPAPVALADRSYDQKSGRGTYGRGSVQVAALPEPPRAAAPPAAPPQLYASAAPAQRGGFHLIAPAMAESLPSHHGGATNGNWSIQVGAFVNEGQARAAASTATTAAPGHPYVGTVKQASNTLYRARVGGLSRDAAVQACEKLAHGKSNCMVISPDSRS